MNNCTGKNLMSKQYISPLIAIIGCDGAGKSTLTSELAQWLGEEKHPVGKVYLGLGSGDMGQKLKKLPLIGSHMNAIVSRKASQARKKGETIPGPLTAFVIFVFSLKRYRSFRRMMKMRREGVLVITDRYPQIEVPGFFDGPGLSSARAKGVFVRFLAAQELKIYQKMADHVPDLVLRLNVDADTALVRKPDHEPGLVKEKAEIAPTLRLNGARIVDLDAVQNYRNVLISAQNAIANTLETYKI
ncbi:MAG: hypothetical protein ABJ327_03290 [Litoreibacter sp.]